MDIESELPDEFDSFSTEKKIKELERLEEVFDEETDSGIIKKRMVQELVRHYKEL